MPFRMRPRNMQPIGATVLPNSASNPLAACKSSLLSLSDAQWARVFPFFAQRDWPSSHASSQAAGQLLLLDILIGQITQFTHAGLSYEVHQITTMA